MSVSEDFGFWGVEAMGFPSEVGRCVAGERLFGVIFPNLYVCPVNMTVVRGHMHEDGTIEWDAAVRERLMVDHMVPHQGILLPLELTEMKGAR